MRNQGAGGRGQDEKQVSRNQGISVRWSIVCGLLFLFSGFCSPSFAHQNSMGYAQFKVSENSVFMNLKMLPHDIDSVLRVDKNMDQKFSPDEIKTAEALIHFYIQMKIKVFSGSKACSYSPAGFFYSATEKYAQVQAQYKCEKGNKLRVESELFFEADSGFRLIGEMDVKGRREEWVFKKGSASWEITKNAPSTLFSQLAHFAGLGVEHIFRGYDHIMFLFGLMLLGGSFRNLLKIVTSFTLAHSITLILASMNVVRLPGRFVESAIALSIMYIAIENLFVKDVDKRWRITFFFGLVHGLGFASVLKELLPQRGVILSLLSFNVGVEIGQACIVSVFFPFLFYLHRFRWSTKFVRFASCIILAFGTFWFFQRALG